MFKRRKVRRPKAPRRTRVRRRPSSSRLKGTLRSAPSWTRWRLKRTRARLLREERRLLLMQAQVEGQHLLLRELEHRAETLEQKRRHQEALRERVEQPRLVLPPQRMEPPEMVPGPMMVVPEPEEPMPDAAAEISQLSGLPQRRT